jgi:type IV secretion system protein VirD4
MDIARHRKKLMAGAAAAMVLGMGVSTQHLASTFNYPRDFGKGWFDSGPRRFYAPWKILSWEIEFGARYRQAFALSEAYGLVIGMVPIFLLIGLSKRKGPKIKEFGADSWGKIEDVKEAGLIDQKQQPRGRVLGMYEGYRLTYLGVEHSLVVGASRSGKGVGHVVPTALSWQHSLFAYDRKGEIWHITADHRKKFSHVIYFAPTDRKTARWNPMFEVRKGDMEIADIQNIVGVLVDPLGAKAGALDFWDLSASQFFVGLILHVLYTAEDTKKNLASVRRLLIDIEPTLTAMIHTKHYWEDVPPADGVIPYGPPHKIAVNHPEIWLGATALLNMDVKVRSSVLGTAQSALTLFADPLVAYATSWSDFAIGDLVCSDNPVSFYLITPQAHADRLAFLVRVFLRQSINSLMEDIDFDSRGRPKKHRLLLMLDEFPKLGGLPFLENALGEMAGYGITCQLFCQSFNDVFGKYGVHTSIFDNMHITVTFATSEPKSIRSIIERAGKALEYRESYSDPRSFLQKGNRSTSMAEQERYILAEQHVRGLPATREFVFVNNAKPIIADKIKHYEDPYYKTVAVDFHGKKRAKFEQTQQTMDRPSAKVIIDWVGVRAAVPFVGAETIPVEIDHTAMSEAQRAAAAREAEATETESDRTRRAATAPQYGSASTTVAATGLTEIPIDDLSASIGDDEDDYT